MLLMALNVFRTIIILGLMAASSSLRAETIDLLCKLKSFSSYDEVVVRAMLDGSSGSFQGERVKKIIVNPESITFLLQCTPKPGKKGCIVTVVDINRYSGRLSTSFSENTLGGSEPEYEGACSSLPDKKF